VTKAVEVEVVQPPLQPSGLKYPRPHPVKEADVPVLSSYDLAEEIYDWYWNELEPGDRYRITDVANQFNADVDVTALTVCTYMLDMEWVPRYAVEGFDGTAWNTWLIRVRGKKPRKRKR